MGIPHFFQGVHTVHTLSPSVWGQEALLPIEVEIPSYKLLMWVGHEPQECWEVCLLDLHKLEATREEAINHYITRASRNRDKFNEQLKDKGLKERMLVLKDDIRLDSRHRVNGWRLKAYLQRMEEPTSPRRNEVAKHPPPTSLERIP